MSTESPIDSPEARVNVPPPGSTEPVDRDAARRGDFIREPDEPVGKPGIGSLLRDLRDETTELFRQEIRLARTEMAEKAAKAGRNAAYVAAGGLVLLAGAMGLMAAAAYAIATILHRAGLGLDNATWIGWLIVGGAVAAIGYVLLQKGISTLKDMDPMPRKTVETIKEDKQWLTNKMS